MKLITMVLLAGLAALNTACGEETGTGKKPTTVAQNTSMATQETLVVAMNTATSKETGTTRTSVTLMAEPYSDAKQAGQLSSNTTVDILERRGGWLRVSAKGKRGWVKLYQVRAGEGPEATKSGEGVAMLKNIGQTGRSGSQGIVATTGIRGLSAENLKTAKPNPKAVAAMDAYRANDSAARDYAHSAGLKDKDVPFLSQN
jgi:Bacterial SH3 domain